MSQIGFCFRLLKNLTKKVAKAHKIPPFAVFQETSIEDMCLNYPISMKDLKNIQGVGEGKSRKFGKEFIDLIKKYVEDNDIERPDDFIIRAVASRSDIKIHIIKNTDKKITLEDIARSKGLEMDDLITEMENVVNSGTRINIDYHIESVMEPDMIEEIYHYFMTDAIDDSVKSAVEEFDGDYTEEEIRLVRIKFLSEVGN